MPTGLPSKFRPQCGNRIHLIAVPGGEGWGMEVGGSARRVLAVTKGMVSTPELGIKRAWGSS